MIIHRWAVILDSGKRLTGLASSKEEAKSIADDLIMKDGYKLWSEKLAILKEK